MKLVTKSDTLKLSNTGGNMAIIIRYVCMAEGCDFCDNDEENAERHAEQYGDKHDLLKIEFDDYYKRAKVKVINTDQINTTTA